jgi:hypothetical protein
MGFIFIFFLLGGRPTTEGRGHFLVCVGGDTMKGQTTCATNTLKNPYLILWFFFNFKIILKFRPLKAIYMCRLLQLLLCVGMGELKAFSTLIFRFFKLLLLFLWFHSISRCLISNFKVFVKFCFELFLGLLCARPTNTPIQAYISLQKVLVHILLHLIPFWMMKRREKSE